MTQQENRREHLSQQQHHVRKPNQRYSGTWALEHTNGIYDINYRIPILLHKVSRLLNHYSNCGFWFWTYFACPVAYVWYTLSSVHTHTTTIQPPSCSRNQYTDQFSRTDFPSYLKFALWNPNCDMMRCAVLFCEWWGHFLGIRWWYKMEYRVYTSIRHLCESLKL